jgi:Domain of unknown function (DUF4271)
MRLILSITSLVYLLAVVHTCAQSGEIRTLDLKDEWMVWQDNRYKKWEGEDVKAIYFTLDAIRFQGGTMEVTSRQSISIFINQMLIVTRQDGPLRLSVDSLAKRYSTPLTVSIFSESGIRTLRVHVIEQLSTAPGPDESFYTRKSNYFLDFSLSASLLLLIYLVFLFSTNARQTLDYLNVFRVFSFQEREENLPTRITSRINILFYVFCCLFCSLTLLVTFYLGAELIPLSHAFPIRSTAEGFLQWIKLSGFIALILFVKLVIVALMAVLFNSREWTAVQHFQFVRALFLASGLVACICVLNFVFEGRNPGLYLALLKVGAGLLVLSAGIVFLKLLGLTRSHFFHLFSYLCASEIIPLVILLKLLLY